MKRIVVLAKLTKGDLNPFDEAALETACTFLPNNEVILVSMGPLSQEERMIGLTRLGVKAILISDCLFAGSDTVATAKILAKAIAPLRPHYIFCGRQSLDGSTAQVPLMVAQLLGYPVYQKAMGYQNGFLSLRSGLEIPLSEYSVVTFERFTTLRAPSIFSKKGIVEHLENEELGLPAEEIGLQGSPTAVVASYRNEKDRRHCVFIEERELENTIREALKKQERLSVSSVAKAPVIHYVGDIVDVALQYGETVAALNLSLRDLDGAKAVLEKEKPSIVLFEETETIKELASRLAVSLGYGLCADCSSFSYRDGRFVITRPAAGGDVIADIVCKSPVSMATVRSPSKEKENVAIVVGRGGIAALPSIRRWAQTLNASIYSTRVVADLDVLPYSTQVGLTGKTISPKVVILVGVSGASQTIVGVRSSETIIAINHDRKAPVFDFADYGIVMDSQRL